MNLSSILNGKRQTLNIEAEFETMELKNDQGLHYQSPLIINGIIRKSSDSIRMNLNIKTKVAVPCSRCLEEAEYPIDMEAEVVLLTEDTVSWEDEYDSFIIENDEIDLIDIATLEILQEILVQPLCGEDCQGICPSCGKNLNTEECNCEKETDSRFDILKELLK